jgi:fatty acid desaturase
VALLVRVFIICHDCGHGSFFASRRANDFWGVVTGIMTFTPFHHWRHEHAIHHGSTGNLDRRGVGDVWTMTVREYLAASALAARSHTAWPATGGDPAGDRAALHVRRSNIVLPRRAPTARELRTRCWLTNLALARPGRGGDESQ